MGAQHPPPQPCPAVQTWHDALFSARLSELSVSGLSLFLEIYLPRSLHIHILESQPSQQSRNRRTAVVRSRLQNPILLRSFCKLSFRFLPHFCLEKRIGR